MKKVLILTVAIIMGMAWSINLFSQDTIRMVWQGWTSNKIFDITATSGELFHVDWGDNSPIQTITATGLLQTLSHNYGNTNNYTVTIFAENANCRLTCFWCFDNQVSDLDVSNSPQLAYLNCRNNQLSDLNVSNNTQLTTLYCYENQLNVLNVNNNTQLTRLYCYNNPLGSLNVSNNAQLTELRCYNNWLNTLDVSSNTNLRELVCSSNQLSSLDVSSNIQLTGLGCANNQLSTLDLSSNTRLSYLFCLGNQLSLSDLYAASLQISNVDYRIFGTQRLPAQVAMTNIALFSSQAEFGGVPTHFYVEKGTVQADSAIDYIVSNGLVFKNTGNYTVTMTNNAIKSNPYYPAKVIAEITVTLNNGIVETDNYPSLWIYPNPTSEYLHVKLAEQQTTEYNICNLMGQVVAHGTLQGEAVINITSLAKGTYFLKIAGATVKIVKI